METLSRDEALSLLRSHKAAIVEQFDIIELSLFGSTARDEADADSDIDILVRFNGPAHYRRYFGLQFYLEDLLAEPVDLVSEKALRKEFRPYVEAEAIRV